MSPKTSRLLPLLCLLGACAKVAQAPRQAIASDASRFALMHADVVDVESGGLLRDRAVVVEEGRITQVGPADAVPDGIVPIDATGKFVIPGLWDMHVHFADLTSGPLFVARGVTGVRLMWSNWHFVSDAQGATLPMPDAPGDRRHYELRDAFESGRAVGPRMHMASDIFDGPKVIWPHSVALATADEARRAVRDARAEGADFIKIYSLLPREVFYAIADETRKLGMPFAGHVPESVTIAEASEAGQKSMEHLIGLPLVLSSKADTFKQRQAEFMASNPDGAAYWKFRRLQTIEAVASHDPARAAALFARFKANGTWIVPTLSMLHHGAYLDDPSGLVSPEDFAFVSPALRRYWDPSANPLVKGRTPEVYAAMRQLYRDYVPLVAAMQRAGVPLLAGTDESNAYILAGAGLHGELQLLVEAGLTPLEALRAATVNPARYLAAESEMGTVAPGKLADLVVLDANPLESIANTRRIHAVVSRGIYYDSAALAGLRDGVRATWRSEARSDSP
ncbi:MAG: amidohydrolase family protein [Myxococcota bacterium]